MYKPANVFAKSTEADASLPVEHYAVKQKLQEVLDAYWGIDNPLEESNSSFNFKTEFLDFVNPKPDKQCNYFRGVNGRGKTRDRYTQCHDCAGIEDGDTKIDLCGNCGGACEFCPSENNEACVECLICKHNPELCQFCQDSLQADPSNMPESCVPQVDCRGSRTGNEKFDACGVCNGDNFTCSSCPAGQYPRKLAGFGAGQNVFGVPRGQIQ